VTDVDATPLPADDLLVETPEGLSHLARALSGSARVALDTEADSLHSFREKVCVVQVAAPAAVAVVDAIAVPDLSPLRDLVASGSVEVVFHGGDYDIGLLRRDHGFSFPRVFDTMVAATLLGDEQVGLAALLERTAGLRLDKKFQKSDWRKRPFGPAELEYLRNDVAHLLALRDLLGARLAEHDLVEEAEIEFRRLAARSLPPPADDPEAWRRMKGADRLDDRSRTVLVSLFRWRDDLARERDVPRFKVLANEAMFALAAWIPLDARALGEMREVPPPIARRHGEEILSALRRGMEAFERGEVPAPREEAPRRDRRAKVRDESLRAWRAEEAKRRGVPTVVVLPNPAVEAIANAPPQDVAALAAIPEVGPKRAARYGEEILRRVR
jgi:ribonuclease D